MSAPVIYKLTIERFRGIKTLSWHPAKGVNVILGGGDVGKTTIIDAIGLLLSPTNPTTIPDTDYYGRITDDGFLIEAVFALPPATGISEQLKPSWPWRWNGKEAVVPSIGDDGEMGGEAVYTQGYPPDLSPFFPPSPETMGVQDDPSEGRDVGKIGRRGENGSTPG